MNIKDLYHTFLDCTGISIDTRSLKPGNVFFAIHGENFDGNKYAKKAIESGAKFAVVDDPNVAINDQYIVVSNSLETLQKLANHHRKQFKGKVIGITGSNGKTTTKELIYQVLKTQFRVQCTQGNLNNHLGVPLTLLSLKMDTEIAIVEMGANHLGEIATLCNIAEPTEGLITNIGTAHIGEFGGRENIIRAKSELFDYLRKHQGQVFINNHDKVLSNMSKRFDNPILYPNELCKIESSSPYIVYVDEKENQYQTNLIGAYNFLNISAAVTIGHYFGLERSKIHKAIKNYIPENNRSQVLKVASNTIIMDAYNANPDSTAAALINLSEFDTKNKVAILGDMKELGQYSMDEHQKIIDFAKDLGFQQICFVGEEYSKANEETYKDISQLIHQLKKNPISNTTVLLKGSRSMAMEQLIEIKEIWN